MMIRNALLPPDFQFGQMQQQQMPMMAPQMPMMMPQMPQQQNAMDVYGQHIGGGIKQALMQRRMF